MMVVVCVCIKGEEGCGSVIRFWDDLFRLLGVACTDLGRKPDSMSRIRQVSQADCSSMLLFRGTNDSLYVN